MKTIVVRALDRELPPDIDKHMYITFLLESIITSKNAMWTFGRIMSSAMQKPVDEIEKLYMDNILWVRDVQALLPDTTNNQYMLKSAILGVDSISINLLEKT